MELSDDVTLKKLLKERTKEKKKVVNFFAGVGFGDAEAEMERLCKVKSRLETIKQRLLNFQNRKANNSYKPSVIYVPVAELREKA